MITDHIRKHTGRGPSPDDFPPRRATPGGDLQGPRGKRMTFLRLVNQPGIREPMLFTLHG